MVDRICAVVKRQIGMLDKNSSRMLPNPRNLCIGRKPINASNDPAAVARAACRYRPAAATVGAARPKPGVAGVSRQTGAQPRRLRAKLATAAERIPPLDCRFEGDVRRSPVPDRLFGDGSAGTGLEAPVSGSRMARETANRAKRIRVTSRNNSRGFSEYPEASR